MKQLKLIWGNFFPIIKNYPIGHLFLYTALLISIIAAEILVPLIYKDIIDSIETISPTGTLSVPAGLTTLFVWWGISFLLLDLSTRGSAFLIVHVQSYMLRDLRFDAFSKLTKHSQTFFNNTFTGSLVSKINSYVDSFEVLHDQTYHGVFIIMFRTIIMLIVITTISLTLGFILLIWTILFVSITFYLLKKQRKLDVTRAHERSSLTGLVADVITNVNTVKAMGREVVELDRVKAKIQKYAEATRRSWFNSDIIRTFQGALASSLHFGGVLLAVMFWSKGLITVGTVVIVGIYITKIYSIVWQLGNDMRRVIGAFSDAEEMIEILDTPIEIVDPIKSTNNPITNGVITFEDVSFTYDAGTTVFENLNLTIHAGERVAIVGHSGAGKSTIVRLLLRFNDVTTGSIKIDGTDIRMMTQEHLRSHIAFVPQEPILFHRSLSENIGYGNLEATQDEIIKSAKLAYAHEFIEKTPLGYDTLVGERGVKLSGGERQRVVIARALLSKAPILILDEATSALDSVTEKYIQESFETLMNGRTTIVIAHRLSTIAKMDRIIVFEDGIIIEDGTHQKLLEKDGVYANLWKSQSEGFIKD